MKIAPGLRLNVSAKSIGLSAGVRGAHVSVNSRGRATRSVGIPGTGLSYVTTSTVGVSGRHASPQRTARPQAAAPRPTQAKPDFRAPQWEKALYKQLKGLTDAAALASIAEANPEVAPTMAMVEVLRVAYPLWDVERLRQLLGWLHDTGYEPATDWVLTKYMPNSEVTVPVAGGITADLLWDRTSIALLLAELEQAHGSLDRAVEVVESLPPSTIAAVSLAELYGELSRWNEVIALTDGVTNEDEAATYLLIQRGHALRELGYFDASREALREALRIRSRPPALRHVALVERGRSYLADGKKAMARKDFERVMAEDSTFPGLADMLQAAS